MLGSKKSISEREDTLIFNFAYQLLPTLGFFETWGNRESWVIIVFALTQKWPSFWLQEISWTRN